MVKVEISFLWSTIFWRVPLAFLNGLKWVYLVGKRCSNHNNNQLVVIGLILWEEYYSLQKFLVVLKGYLFICRIIFLMALQQCWKTLLHLTYIWRIIWHCSLFMWCFINVNNYIVISYISSRMISVIQKLENKKYHHIGRKAFLLLWHLCMFFHECCCGFTWFLLCWQSEQLAALYHQRTGGSTWRYVTSSMRRMTGKGWCHWRCSLTQSSRSFKCSCTFFFPFFWVSCYKSQWLLVTKMKI